MRIFGLQIGRRKSTGGDLVTRLPQDWSGAGGGWWGFIRERFAGAWQRSAYAPVADVMTHSTAWACITLIASDIAKLRLKLTKEDDNGICEEIDNPAFSAVLRKPNHFQNRIQFLKCWVISKLTRGNTYVLKERNHRGGTNRGNVVALYVLDPSRVQVLVAPDGSVFYQLTTDYLSGLGEASVTVPASEIIHDIMIPLYHPLVGVGPIHACGRAVMQGLKILHGSERFFETGSQLSGVLTAPASISNEVADRIQKHWDTNYAGEANIGRVAVLGDGLKFEPMSMTAVQAQLIEQLKWGDEKVCATFHVPGYMVGVGAAPLNNNVEALAQQYYSQCLQELIESIELCLVEGLELTPGLGVELDLDGLLRMDSATKMTTAKDGVAGGIYAPNEARAMFNKKPVVGGDTPYLQQQNFSLAALDRRDKAAPAPASTTAPPSTTTEPTKEWSEDAHILVYTARAKAMGLPVPERDAREAA